MTKVGDEVALIRSNFQRLLSRMKEHTIMKRRERDPMGVLAIVCFALAAAIVIIVVSLPREKSIKVYSPVITRYA